MENRLSSPPSAASSPPSTYTLHSALLAALSTWKKVDSTASWTGLAGSPSPSDSHTGPTLMSAQLVVISSLPS